MKVHSSTASAVAVLLCVLVAPNRAAQGPPAGGADARVFDTHTKQRIRVVTVASGLVHPWSIGFLPDGRTMLVAERSGRLRIIRDGVLDPAPVWDAPDQPAAPSARVAAAAAAQAAQATPAGQAPPATGGTPSLDRLHAVAVHPRFAQNHWVYLSHPKSGPRGTTLAVSRGRLEGATLTDVREIFVADAWETSGNMAGRMLFGPGRHAVRRGRRPRPAVLHRNGGQQPADEGAGSRQPRREGAADHGRGRRAQGQSVTWVARRQAGDLHLRAPQHLRAGVSSGNRGAVAGGDRPAGRRRGQYSPARPELRLAGGLDGPQLHRLARLGRALVPEGHGESADVLGAVHQPLQHRVLHRDQVPDAGRAVSSSAPSTARASSASRSTSRRRPNGASRCSRPMDIRIRDVVQGPDGNLYVATEKGSGGNNPDGTILRIEPAE